MQRFEPHKESTVFTAQYIIESTVFIMLLMEIKTLDEIMHVGNV
jgi:hypothetical protein